MKFDEYLIKDGQCGAEQAFKIIGARWKPKILNICYLQNGASFSVLKQEIHGCSDASLSRQINSLVQDKMLYRNADETTETSVAYVLTEQARDIIPIMIMMQQLTYFCNYPTSNYEDAVEYANKMIGSKWKSRIVWVIHAYGTIRFNKLQKSVEGISHKMLNEQLSDLRQYGLIKKVDYQEKPPRTEYSLTQTGELAFQIIQRLAAWGKKSGFIKSKIVISN